MENFKQMQEYVDWMKSTSSTKEKETILKNYKDVEFVKKCVLYTLDPYRMYGITSKQIKKVADIHRKAEVNDYTSIFDLLDDLADRLLTGHDAVYHVLDFVALHPDYTQLIYNMIDKDIETRANATLVNKVWGKGFIPKFDVALANKYEPKLVDFNDTWFSSRKLDGLRCICKIDEEGIPTFYSRKGKVFLTLGTLGDNVIISGLKDIVLDGELCIMNGELEDFVAISKEYNKKNHTIVNPKFFIFDALSHEEFGNGSSNRSLRLRLGELKIIPKGFEVLEQSIVESDKEVAEQLDKAIERGQEGLILRRNCRYKGKRSNDILKVKSFQDAEYEVISATNGKMRFFENGKDVSRETLSKVTIIHKGEEVDVGSGFSKDERAHFYANPASIIGKIITVQYFGESQNSDGKVSLRFPTLKAIHGLERQV